MKIVEIARHCCIRVQKQAIPLMDKGYEVHCIANKPPMFGDRYKTLTIYQHRAQMEEAIKLHEDADIFHAHNEPSWFVTIIKSIFPDKPVVLDCHDSFLLRVDPDAPYDPDRPKWSKDERDNMELADALVFVSEPMAQIVRETYWLEQPYVVLPSYVPEEFYRVDAWKLLGGVCMEGRVDLPQEIEQGREHWCFWYCEYTETARQFHERGIPFYLYTPGGTKEIQETYGQTATWKGSYPFDRLIRQIGRHEYGLCGNIRPHPAWQAAMPNKLFEYLAAGIPVIALNAKHPGQFIEEHGFGMAVENMGQVKERWMEHRDFRKNIARRSRDWAMERHIDKLEALYRELV